MLQFVSYLVIINEVKNIPSVEIIETYFNAVYLYFECFGVNKLFQVVVFNMAPFFIYFCIVERHKIVGFDWVYTKNTKS